MLVNHPSSDKGHHETIRSTGFPLIHCDVHAVGQQSTVETLVHNRC
jgi:hypothetical protein